MPRLLDPYDELGLAWDEVADGRVHRLIRGRDFVRSGEHLDEAADNAARRLGRVVRTFKEVRWGVLYFWVQFVDHEVVIGDPCPCGGELFQVNLNFAECGSCKATVALLKPKKEKPVEEEGEDEALLQSLFGVVPGAWNGRRRDGPPLDPRADVARLGAYSKVVLYRARADEDWERLYGRAVGPGGGVCLLVLDLPLVDGERILDPAYPGGFAHTVWSVPVSPFGGLIRLESLEEREPVLTIDDPLAGYDPSSSNGAPAGGPRPPERLSDLDHVSLFPYRSGETKKGGRFGGMGRTRDGEPVLVTARYRDDVSDPESAVVRCVPVAPFGAVIDVAALFAMEPGAPLSEPQPAEQKPGLAVDPKDDVTRLGAYTEVELFPLAKGPRYERMRGQAIGPGGQASLLVVEFPLENGERIRDRTWAGGWRHAVWSVPVGPLQRVLREEPFAGHEPALRIDDPLSSLQPVDPPPEPVLAVPASLDELEDVHLVRYGGKEQKKRENYFGYARTPTGDTLLLTLRRQRDAQHRLRCVPLSAFEDVVDTEALFSLEFEAPGAERDGA